MPYEGSTPTTPSGQVKDPNLPKDGSYVKIPPPPPPQSHQQIQEPIGPEPPHGTHPKPPTF
jgi:hypothetical protein